MTKNNLLTIILVFIHFLSHGQLTEDKGNFINHENIAPAGINPVFFQFKPIDSLINRKVAIDYNATRKVVERKRIQLLKRYKEASDSIQKKQILDSTLRYFTHQLVNHVIPHWYGTTWSFNGYSAIPGQGTIACGYFMSTTLKHMGINLSRYRMAQAGPKDEARYLCFQAHDLDSLVYSSSKKANILDVFDRLANGFYFVGLDYHVGFLLKKENTLLFIHSNYVDGYVMAEHAFQSEAFESEKYYFAKISGNYEFAKARVLGLVFNSKNK